jgi:hypothetical protein
MLVKHTGRTANMAHRHQMEHVQTKERRSAHKKNIIQKRQWMLGKCQGAFMMQGLGGEFARMHRSTRRKRTDLAHPGWGTCKGEYKETKTPTLCTERNHEAVVNRAVRGKKGEEKRDGMCSRV